MSGTNFSFGFVNPLDDQTHAANSSEASGAVVGFALTSIARAEVDSTEVDTALTSPSPSNTGGKGKSKYTSAWGGPRDGSLTGAMEVSSSTGYILPPEPKKGKTTDTSPLRGSTGQIGSYGLLHHQNPWEDPPLTPGLSFAQIDSMRLDADQPVSLGPAPGRTDLITLDSDLILSNTLLEETVLGIDGGLIPVPPTKREVNTVVESLLQFEGGTLLKTGLQLTLGTISKPDYNGQGVIVWRKTSFDGPLPLDEAEIPFPLGPHLTVQWHSVHLVLPKPSQKAFSRIHVPNDADHSAQMEDHTRLCFFLQPGPQIGRYFMRTTCVLGIYHNLDPILRDTAMGHLRLLARLIHKITLQNMNTTNLIGLRWITDSHTWNSRQWQVQLPQYLDLSYLPPSRDKKDWALVVRFSVDNLPETALASHTYLANYLRSLLFPPELTSRNHLLSLPPFATMAILSEAKLQQTRLPPATSSRRILTLFVMSADGVIQPQLLLHSIISKVPQLTSSFWPLLDMIGLTDSRSRKGTKYPGSMAGVFMFAQVNLDTCGMSRYEIITQFTSCISCLAQLLSYRLSIHSVHPELTQAANQRAAELPQPRIDSPFSLRNTKRGHRLLCLPQAVTAVDEVLPKWSRGHNCVLAAAVLHRAQISLGDHFDPENWETLQPFALELLNSDTNPCLSLLNLQDRHQMTVGLLGYVRRVNAGQHMSIPERMLTTNCHISPRVLVALNMGAVWIPSDNNQPQWELSCLTPGDTIPVSCLQLPYHFFLENGHVRTVRLSQLGSITPVLQNAGLLANGTISYMPPKAKMAYLNIPAGMSTPYSGIPCVLRHELRQEVSHELPGHFNQEDLFLWPRVSPKRLLRHTEPAVNLTPPSHGFIGATCLTTQYHEVMVAEVESLAAQSLKVNTLSTFRDTRFTAKYPMSNGFLKTALEQLLRHGVVTAHGTLNVRVVSPQELADHSPPISYKKSLHLPKHRARFRQWGYPIIIILPIKGVMEIALSPEASARTRSYAAGSPEIRAALETYDLHILRVGHWLAFRHDIIHWYSPGQHSWHFKLVYTPEYAQQCGEGILWMGHHTHSVPKYVRPSRYFRQLSTGYRFIDEAEAILNPDAEFYRSIMPPLLAGREEVPVNGPIASSQAQETHASEEAHESQIGYDIFVEELGFHDDGNVTPSHNQVMTLSSGAQQEAHNSTFLIDLEAQHCSSPFIIAEHSVGEKRRNPEISTIFLDMCREAHTAIRLHYGQSLLQDIQHRFNPQHASKVYLKRSGFGNYRLVAAQNIYSHPRFSATAIFLGPLPLCDSGDTFARIIHTAGAYYAISSSPFLPWLNFPSTPHTKKPNNLLSYIGSTSKHDEANTTIQVTCQGPTVQLLRNIKKGEAIAFYDSFSQPFVSIRSYAEVNQHQIRAPLLSSLWTANGKLKPIAEWVEPPFSATPEISEGNQPGSLSVGIKPTPKIKKIKSNKSHIDANVSFSTDIELSNKHTKYYCEQVLYSFNSLNKFSLSGEHEYFSVFSPQNTPIMLSRNIRYAPIAPHIYCLMNYYCPFTITPVSIILTVHQPARLYVNTLIDSTITTYKYDPIYTLLDYKSVNKETQINKNKKYKNFYSMLVFFTAYSYYYYEPPIISSGNIVTTFDFTNDAYLPIHNCRNIRYVPIAPHIYCRMNYYSPFTITSVSIVLTVHQPARLYVNTLIDSIITTYKYDPIYTLLDYKSVNKETQINKNKKYKNFYSMLVFFTAYNYYYYELPIISSGNIVTTFDFTNDAYLPIHNCRNIRYVPIAPHPHHVAVYDGNGCGLFHKHNIASISPQSIHYSHTLDEGHKTNSNSPHYLHRLYGKGYSSDPTGDGPLPVTRKSKISAKPAEPQSIQHKITSYLEPITVLSPQFPLTFHCGRITLTAQREVLSRIISRIQTGLTITAAVETEIIYSPHQAQLSLKFTSPSEAYYNTPTSGLCMLHMIHQLLNLATEQGYLLPKRLHQLLRNPDFLVARTEGTRARYLTLIDIILELLNDPRQSFPYFIPLDIQEAIRSLTSLQLFLCKRGTCNTPIPPDYYLVDTIGRATLGALGLEVHEWHQSTSTQFLDYYGSSKASSPDLIFCAQHLRRALGGMFQFAYGSFHYYTITADESLIPDFDDALRGLSNTVIEALHTPSQMSIALSYAERHPYTRSNIDHHNIPYPLVFHDVFNSIELAALQNLTSAGHYVLPFDTIDVIAKALHIRVVTSRTGLNRGLALGGPSVPSNTILAEYIGLTLNEPELQARLNDTDHGSSEYVVALHDGTGIDGRGFEQFRWCAHLANTSPFLDQCNANIIELTDAPGRIFLESTRPIQTGEEILVAYSTTDNYMMDRLHHISPWELPQFCRHNEIELRNNLSWTSNWDIYIHPPELDLTERVQTSEHAIDNLVTHTNTLLGTSPFPVTAHEVATNTSTIGPSLQPVQLYPRNGKTKTKNSKKTPPLPNLQLNWRWTDPKCSHAEWKTYKYRAPANDLVAGRIIPTLPIICPSLALKQSPIRKGLPRAARKTINSYQTEVSTDILQFYEARAGGHQDLREGPGHSLEFRLAPGQSMAAGSLLIPVVGKIRSHLEVNLIDSHKSPFYIRLRDTSEVIDPTVVTHDIGYQSTEPDAWSTINYGAYITLRSQHACPVCLEIQPTQLTTGSWFYETTTSLTNHEDHEVWYPVVLKTYSNNLELNTQPTKHFVQIPNHRKKNIRELSTRSAEQPAEGPAPRVKLFDTANPSNKQLYGSDHLIGLTSKGALRIATFNCDGCFSIGISNGRIPQADYLQKLRGYIDYYNIHIMCLQDIRVSSTQSCIFKRHLQVIFPDFGFHLLPSLFSSGKSCEQSDYYAVGGQLIIYRKNLSLKLIRHKPDITKQGCLVITTFRLRNQKRYLRLASVYIPCTPGAFPALTDNSTEADTTATVPGPYTDSGKLYHKMQADMVRLRISSHSTPEPIKWIYKKLHHTLQKCTHKGDIFVMVGDFNDTCKDIPDIIPLAFAENQTLDMRLAKMDITHHMLNMAKTAQIPVGTFFRTQQSTCIDHCFTNLPYDSIEQCCYSAPGDWSPSSHVPIWMGIILPNFEGNSHHRTILEVEHLTIPTVRIKWDNVIQKNLYTDTVQTKYKFPPLNAPLLDTSDEETKRTLDEIGAKFAERMHLLADIGRQIFCKGRPTKKIIRKQWFSHHWSLAQVCGRAHLLFLTRVLSHKIAVHRYTFKGSHSNSHMKLCKHLAEWDGVIQYYFRNQPTETQNYLEHEATLKLTDRPLHWWLADHTRLYEIDTDTLTSDIILIRKQLHTRARRAQRAQIQNNSLKRELKFQTGEFKLVKHSLLSLPNIRWTSDEIVDGNNNPVTNPRAVHDIVTEHWRDIYSVPVTSVSEVLSLELPNLGSIDEWEHMLADPTYFVQKFKYALPTSVTDDQGLMALLTQFSEEFHLSLDPLAITELSANLAEDPTFAEYQQVIKSGPLNSGPGLTGLTYGLLKLLPEAVLYDLYCIQLICWKHKYIPAIWQIKLIQFLQKVVGSASLNDLRPIGLIEVTRKAWSIIILRKITRVLKRYPTLAESQYGFRAGKGTDSHLIQLLRVLEEAQEQEFHIDLASWDQKKAFDSIGKNLQYIGWRRIGVPPHIAKWLASLDLNGVYLVKSKFSCHELATNTDSIISKMAICNRLGLRASRGATQGDVISPTAWNITFDPLIRTLERFYSTHPIHLLGPDSTVEKVEPCSYADDLITITCTREDTQTVSNIICLWITLVGLQLSPGTSAEPKLRLLTSFPEAGHLTVHDWKWDPLILPFSDTNSPAKILGIPITLSLNWSPALKKADEIIQKACSTLLVKKAFLSTKGAILITCTINAVLYILQFAGVDCSQVARLDKALLSLYRAHHCIGYFTATDILYNPLLGGGLPSLIDLIRQRKTNIYHRLTQEGGRARSAVEAMILRRGRWTEFIGGIPLCQHDLSASGRTFSIPSHSGVLGAWSNSLFTQVDNAKLTATFHGYHNFGADNFNLYTLTDGKKIINVLDLQRIEDIIDWSGSKPRKLKLNFQPLRNLGAAIHSDFNRALEYRLTCPRGSGATCRLQRGHCVHIQLHPDQQLRLQTSHSSCLFILQGFDLYAEAWFGTLWVPLTTKRAQTRYCQSNHQEIIGATGSISFPKVTIEQGTLAIVSDHKAFNFTTGLTLLGLNPSLTLVTQARAAQLPRTPGMLVSSLLQWMAEHQIMPITACTDGSFKIANRPLSGMFEPPSVREISAGGAIVFANDNFDPKLRNQHLYNFGGPSGVIRITDGHLVFDPSSNLMEMLPTLLLQQLRFHYLQQHQHRIIVYSDCQSNIKIVKNARPYSYRNLVIKYESEIYHNLVESYIGNDINWVPGHIDQDKYKKGKKVRERKSLQDLAHHEWLNIIADKYSAYKPLDTDFLQREQFDQCPVREVKAQDILDSMGGPGRVTWAINGNTVRDNVIAETSPTPTHLYLQKRERRSVGHTPWSTLSVGLLIPMLRQNRHWRTPGNRLGLLRLIWDYLPHGRNKVKGTQAPLDQATFSHQQYWDSLPRCPLGCNLPYDRHHILTECQNPIMHQARQTGLNRLQALIKMLSLPYLEKYWELILNTLQCPDPTRLSSSIMIGCPHRSQLDSWDSGMPTRFTRFSQPDLDKAECASAPLFNHLLCLSRTLWYTYCQEAHPKQLDNNLVHTNIQQTLQFSQASSSDTTQASYKAYFKDRTGVPLDAHSSPDPPTSPLTPMDSLVGYEHMPHAIELKWEDWNNIK